MQDSITIPHYLTGYSVTNEPETVVTIHETKMVLTRGVMETGLPEICPECRCKHIDIHQHHEITLRHLPLMTKPHSIVITRARGRCRACGKIVWQPIPFQLDGHRITKHLAAFIISFLEKGYTLKEVSQITATHPSIVKEIDRERLKQQYDQYRPKEFSRYIAIDEFLLHKGHRYATVVIDLETGHVLFCEEGKKKEQVYHFIEQMGDRWMNQVEAVAMDMNAQYDSAFREKAPQVKIVYDLFHLVKLYNDKVLTAMRRRKQNELQERGDQAGYTLFKGSRYLLLSNRSTLQDKDSRAKKNNRSLSENYLKKGLSLPPGARIMHTGHEAKLDALLSANSEFSAAYILLEQLKLAFKTDNEKELASGMRSWLKLARQCKSEEIHSYADTIDNHLDGIVNHARFPISTGKLEGTNNMIKTIRRKAYGLPDTPYFFWKIMEASRKPYAHFKSHRFLR
jgi:transposase